MKKTAGPGRLPEYYKLMRSLLWQNVRRTSSGELAASLGVSPSTVRKDLERFEGCSRSGYGIDVAALFRSVGKSLGTGRVRNAVMLTENRQGSEHSASQFELLGVMIAARCDSDDVLDTIGSLKPEILVICGCSAPGQIPGIASAAVRMGVRGILDYTGSDLSGAGCPVARVDPVGAMTDLIFQMTINEKENS